MITIVLNGVEYKRDYKPNFCDWDDCGKRIEFRLSIKGVPESSDKYNARRCCCNGHSRKLQQSRKRRQGSMDIMQMWLCGKV